IAAAPGVLIGVRLAKTQQWSAPLLGAPSNHRHLRLGNPNDRRGALHQATTLDRPRRTVATGRQVTDDAARRSRETRPVERRLTGGAASTAASQAQRRRGHDRIAGTVAPRTQRRRGLTEDQRASTGWTRSRTTS